ncbi:MAG: MBL fold metallo-hydrolase [archaeon]|nr:MBL fold metallo-hydrolase [archaeon]
MGEPSTSESHLVAGVTERFPQSYFSNVKSLRMKMPVHVKWMLQGNSWSCDKTAFAIPELEMHLDAGYLPSTKHPRYVFLTHCHGDHSTDLPRLVSRHKPPFVFLPAEAAEGTRGWLDSYICCKLNMHSSEAPTLLPSYHLVPVKEGARIPLPGCKTGMVIEPIRCIHSVPCFGYGFLELRQKLLPEYAALSGREIATLRKRGAQLTHEVEVRYFAYLGDTTADVFVQNPHLFKYPVVICECTFLYEENRARAVAKRHTLWPDLEPHVVAHPETVFVLIHFSHRHVAEEVRRFFQEKSLPNVVAWVAAEHASEEDPGDPVAPIHDAE